MSERVPWAIGTTMVAMLVVLFLLFGSVVLPIKAVLMTLLSLTASFGCPGLDLPGGATCRGCSTSSPPATRSPATRS
jgi:uncharacterized membrane protein YdfJ with MMPL/SSD domain